MSNKPRSQRGSDSSLGRRGGRAAARQVFGRAIATASVLGGVFAAAALAANAHDYAVCAGVNHYPNLRAGADLTGCVNDAKLFAHKLEQLGFHDPIVLADATATKSGILGKITSLKDSVHAGDRVVIYFAGHGTLSTSGESVLLPSDAQDASEQNDIQVKELYDAVKSLGGDDVQKTVVLDSCHSGGMVRGIAGLRSFHNLVPRLYIRTKVLNQKATNHRDIKRWQETDTNGGDDLTNVVHTESNPGSGGICYFTAAQKNEVANETTVGGEEHGLFTYYLVSCLKANGDIWKDISAAVSGKVWTDTDYEQKPQLFPSDMMGRVVFGGSASPNPKPLGLDGIFNLSNPDKNIISVKRFLTGADPETAPIPVASKNYFEIRVGQDGYLVVVGRDPHNDLDIIYPKTPTAESMQVHAGQVIRLPGNPNHFMAPDTPGTDSIKAILFSAPDKANAMLQPFKDSNDRGYKSLNIKSASRAWNEVDGGEAPTADVHFYTSEITTLIVPADGGGAAH